MVPELVSVERITATSSKPSSAKTRLVMRKSENDQTARPRSQPAEVVASCPKVRR